MQSTIVTLRLRLFVFALALISTTTGTSACAHLTFESATEYKKPWYQRWFAQSDGIHYYRSKPYVLITESKATKDTESSCVVEIKYLPDYSQEYVIIPHYWIGSVALKPTLADGWNLTNFDSTVDTKVPETLNALAAGLKAAAPGGVAPLVSLETEKGKGTPGNVRPGLYATEPYGDRLIIDTEFPVFAATGSVCTNLYAAPPPKAPTAPPPPQH